MKTLIGINGVCGRMGQRVLQLAAADPELSLVAALEHPD
ncbi:MAG: 4-hydroxy-tetrahydrodipicolinate reductase, partial [Gemmataceae bacterium]|nr:4-hydroxy-tetrahydrodipicolinate reductase [Gemmataceae bacterium]